MPVRRTEIRPGAAKAPQPKPTTAKPAVAPEPRSEPAPDTRPKCARCNARSGAVGWRDNTGCFVEIDPAPLQSVGLRAPCDVWATIDAAGRVVHLTRIALMDTRVNDAQTLPLCLRCRIYSRPILGMISASPLAREPRARPPPRTSACRIAP